MKLKPYCTRLVHVPLNQPEKLTHAQKHESQHNDRLLLQQIRNTQAKEMAVGPLARLLAQLVVPVISVLARALPAAYAQALQNARKAGVSHEEATKAASQMLRKTLSKTEALQILNLSETEATAEAIQKVRMNSLCPLIPSCLKIDCHNQFTHSFVHTFSLTQQFDRYMKANDVKDGSGSFYLQSKVYRAKELLDEFQKEQRMQDKQRGNDRNNHDENEDSGKKSSF